MDPKPDGRQPFPKQEADAAMSKSRSPRAMTLQIADEERLEDRVRKMVSHAMKEAPTRTWNIQDIDATGPLGGRMTARRNDEGVFHITGDELLEILAEDGQVLELDATQGVPPAVRIVVRDGRSVDVLGFEPMPDERVVGPFSEVDPNLFLWPPGDAER